VCEICIYACGSEYICFALFILASNIDLGKGNPAVAQLCSTSVVPRGISREEGAIKGRFTYEKASDGTFWRNPLHLP